MKKLLALFLAALPFILVLLVLGFGPNLSDEPAEYYDLVGNVSNLIIAIGALLAAYQYALPMIAYLYYADQLENEDVWSKFIHTEGLTFNGKNKTVLNIFLNYHYNRRMWWDPACAIADNLYYLMGDSTMNGKSLNKLYQKYKEDFQNFAHHVALNNVGGETTYNNLEEAEQMVESLKNQYNIITAEINKKKVPQWIRDILEAKYHKEATVTLEPFE